MVIYVDESKVLADLIDRRNRKTSTIIVSQYEPVEWIEQIPNPDAADTMTEPSDAGGSVYRKTLAQFAPRR